MKIYKYEMPVGVEFTLTLPSPFSILSAISQSPGMLSLYCCTMPEDTPEIKTWDRRFIAIVTGEQVPAFTDFIATVIDASGPGLIWHLFEIGTTNES